jgi:hypothetical protein
MSFHATAQELLATSRYIMSTYLSDMSDDDILVCPVEGAHHTAWQLGHLTVNERRMVEGVKSGAGIALPPSFEHAHGKEVAVDSQAGFWKVSEYREMMTTQRTKTLELLASLTEGELAKPAPEFMRGYARYVSSVFLSIASHETMHAGQIAVVRRRLVKPVLI